MKCFIPVLYFEDIIRLLKMALFKIFLWSFAFLISSTTAMMDLPDFVKPCNRSDPNFNECLTDSIESLKPYLANGISELKIPKCEPLLLPKIDIEKPSLCDAFSNIFIWGLNNFTVKSISYDENENDFHLRMKFPNLVLKMDYLIEHFMFVLPLKGEGTCGGNYSNINVDVIIDMVKSERDDYLYCQDAIVKFDVGEACVTIDNTAGDIKIMGVPLNNIINERWSEIETEMRPTISLLVSRLIRAYVNSFFKVFPLHILMPK